MIDRLRQMAIFAKTIDHGSFRGAAKALRLSPSVVSHHISELEAHLGVALLYRSTRKLTLTREGERLLAATHKMLGAVEGELLALTAGANAPSGELRITMPSVLSQSGLTDQIAAFSRTYPRINLILDFSDTRRALIDDGFDIAIRMGPKPKGTRARTLFRVHRRLVAATSYLEGRPTVTEPKELLGWDWLALTPAQKVPIAFHGPDGQRVPLKPKSTLFANDAQALFRLARAGAGLAIVPEYLTHEDIAAGKVTLVLPDWTHAPIEVFAVWPQNAPRYGLIHLALDALSRQRSATEA